MELVREIVSFGWNGIVSFGWKGDSFGWNGIDSLGLEKRQFWLEWDRQFWQERREQVFPKLPQRWQVTLLAVSFPKHRAVLNRRMFSTAYSAYV